MPFETVAIPVTKGINLRTAARLVEPPALLEAKNARFGGDGSSKRYGHVPYKVRVGSYPANTPGVNITPPTLTPYGAKVVDSDWLYGWGIITGPDTGGFPLAISPYPEPGLLLGGLERDTELLAWTGHSLISFAPSQTHTAQGALITPACIPVCNVAPIAKKGTPQNHPDIADNGKVRVVVWSDNAEDDEVGQIYMSAYDSVTQALLIDTQSLEFTDAYHPRIVSMGGWFHIFALERDTDKLVITSVHENSLDDWDSANVGDCENYYDVWKVDETRVVTIRSDGTSLFLNWFQPDGNTPDDEVGASELDLGIITLPTVVGICSHPTTGKLGITFLSSDTLKVYAGMYDRDGTLNGALTDLGQPGDPGPALSGIVRLSIAPTYLLNEDSEEEFDIYVTGLGGAGENEPTTKRFRVKRTGFADSDGIDYTLYNYTIASHAFRVGNRTYIWAAHSTLLQCTWYLLDESLRQVGCVNYGVADSMHLVSQIVPTLRSVNWINYNGLKDQMVFHLALGYKQRVKTTDEQEGLYTEPSIQFLTLDFLPKLRSVQAGRSTYIAGAQLWAYDGRELVESGFHQAPEFTLTPASGGTLLTDTYSYRVDLCYRNAQNEEVRSHSFIKQVEIVGEGTQSVDIEINMALTRRVGAYFLIFRNAILDGAPTSTWNLLNSRDPLSDDFIVNDPSDSATVTYTDDGDVADAEIINRELHPGNSGTYQHPFPSPACEIIASGRDRVWLAGGELPFGMIAPSRLFNPGETPAWNGNIVVQVDRNESPITGIGFVGDIAVVFRERFTYVQEGDGPDNQANGFWPPARLALADTGAINSESIVLCSSGLLFQSPAGFRMIGPGGQLAPIGEPVDPLAVDFETTGAAIISAQSEVRWYSRTGALVYNYLSDAWSTWTCGAVAALRGSRDTHAVLVREDGWFWVETPGLYRDGQSTYEHKIRFPWLHAGALIDFQRLRRFAGFGTWDPEEPHQVRVEIFYDEREFPHEWWEWDVPDATQNTDTWGADEWGGGTWGDTASARAGRDSVWRWRRMPRRQKCSVFSISVGDNFTDGPGFSMVGLGLELMRKTGLDRTRAPGGTSTSRP